MAVAYPRLRVSLVAYKGNQAAICSFHYGANVGLARDINSADLLGVAALAEAALGASFKACLSADAAYLGLRLRYEGPIASGDMEVKYDAGADQGGWPDPGSLPSQLAGVIGKQAAESGRHGRGRVYIPFPGETAQQASGLISSDYANALDTMADAMKDNLTYTWGGVSTVLRPAIFSPVRASNPYFIVTTAYRFGFGTQRRRGFFGRPNVNQL